MKLSQSVKPISQVKARMSEIIEDMTKTHRTFVITHNGEARAVLQDIESYEEMQESLAMLEIVAMSSKSIEQGRSLPAAKAFAKVRERVQSDARKS